MKFNKEVNMAEKILFQKDKYIVGITEEGNLYETYGYTNCKIFLEQQLCI